MCRLLAIAVAMALLVPGVPATMAASDEPEPTEPLAWTRLGRVFGGGDIHDLVSLPDGTLVAFGSLGETSARVWHSSDGYGWGEAALPGRDHASVVDVELADGGLVAVGNRRPPGQESFEGVVWASDDGREWRELHVFAEVQAVDAFSTAEGYVVVTVEATTKGPGPFTIWRSIDGSEWYPAEVRDAGPWVEFLGSARTATDAWVLVGRERESGIDRMWRSEDAMTWEPIASELRAPSSFAGLVEVPSGVLRADVRHRDRGTGIRHSVDGREWTTAVVIDDGIVAISGGPLGVAALTRPTDRSDYGRDYPVSLLRSEDGLRWSTTAVPELVGKLVRKVVSMPDGQVLAIRRLNDITWLGRPTSLPPLILPEPTPNPRGRLLSFKALVKRGDHPEGEFDAVGDDVVEYFEEAGDRLDPIHLAWPSVDELVGNCKREMAKVDGNFDCLDVLLRLHKAHGLTRDPRPYELADRWLGVTMRGDDVRPDRERALERLRWARVAHPDWFKD
jgi:hypothetical protein